jgi:hypothetical protein
MVLPSEAVQLEGKYSGILVMNDATDRAANDHASHAAVRALILSTPRPRSLVPCVTTPLYSTTVSQALRLTLRGKGLNNIDPHHQPRGHGGPEDVEGDTSSLISFSIDGEHCLYTSSEATQSLSNVLLVDSNGGVLVKPYRRSSWLFF